MVTGDQSIESFEAEYGVKVEVVEENGDMPLVQVHADTLGALTHALHEGWGISLAEVNDEWVQPERSAFDEANPYQS